MEAQKVTDKIESFNNHFDNSEAVRTETGIAIIVRDTEEVARLTSKSLPGDFTITSVDFDVAYVAEANGVEDERYVNDAVAIVKAER